MFNILIIEDEKLLADLQKTLITLKIKNVNVEIINNTNQLEKINNKKYDLTIIDYHINNQNMQKTIKKYLNLNVPVILTSGDTNIDLMLPTKYKSDKLHILRKPFDVNILINIIKKYIKEENT